jgi:hypothetical protein
MPLITGDANCTTGLSKRIRDACLAQMTSATDNVELKKFAYAIALAVVAEIQANATATVVTACPAGAGTGTGTVG